MSCKEIAVPPKAVLAKTDSLETAARALRANDFTPLPVVDAKGRFKGVFGPRELLTVLLPGAARLGEQGITDLSFVSDSMADIRNRLGHNAKEPIAKLMAPHRTVRPDTSLVEAVLLLSRGDAFLPVVDDTGKLVGVVDAASALAHITEGW